MSGAVHWITQHWQALLFFWIAGLGVILFVNMRIGDMNAKFDERNKRQ